MKHININRIVAIFMCLIMLFSVLPIQVFANESDIISENITFVFDEENGHICEECGGHNSHLESCSLYTPDYIYSVEDDAEIIDIPDINGCTCGLDVHIESCPLYKEVIIDELTCTCNSNDGIHSIDCVLYTEPINKCFCGSEDNTHTEDCYLYEGPIADECTCNSAVHVSDCPLYEELSTPSNAVCDCEGEHSKECSLYEPFEITFSYLISITSLSRLYEVLYNQYEVISTFENQEKELLLLYVEELYSLIEEPIEDDEQYYGYLYNIINSYIIVICDSCGQEDGLHLDDCEFWTCNECGEKEHAENCSQNIKIDVYCSECNEKNGVHLETCQYYIADEKVVCSECQQENNTHLDSCSFYVCEVCNEHIHDKGCKYYIPSIFEILLESESLEVFYENLLDEEHFNDVLELTTDEINELVDVVVDLYDMIAEPSDEDLALRDEIIETLSVLPNGDIENPVKVLEYLEWGGEQAGMTLTQDVVLIADTYMTSKITIPSGANVTIDLNGYMLKGNGTSEIFSNNGKLTIVDSRPDFGSHTFKTSTTSAWTLDETGDYIITGGIITGGRGYNGGAVAQTSNSKTNVLYIEGGTFVGNYASRSGGASYGGSITMRGGSIVGNYAETFAGGLCVSGTFLLEDGLIGYNQTNPNSQYNNPTATSFFDNADLLIGSQSSFDMVGGEIIGTVTSDWYGNANASHFNFSGGKITGSFRVINGLTANISGGEIEGSVYMKSGQCIISGDALIHNGDGINGGTVQIDGGSVLMKDGIIRDGSAINGGAVYVQNGDFIMNDGLISDSSAENGGAVYIDGGTFVMYGGFIENNTADYGGAVYVNDGSFEVYDGEFYDNMAIDGGAAYIDGGTVINIYNGIFDSNEASNNGGAIYATSDASDIVINVFDGVITNNIAGNHAGAIGASTVGDYAVVLNIGEEDCLGVNHTLHDDGDCPIIDGNTASRLGGAFCLHGNSDKLAVNIYCGEVTGNIAIRNPGSNSINQGGGTVTVWGGQIDPGIMVGGGIYTDNRIQSTQMTLRFWSNYPGGPADPHPVEVTVGVNVTFPLDTYVWEGHELSGWATAPDASGLYIPAQGEYAIPYNASGYLDFYAVWDADTSYIVYIPETLDIEDDWEGELVISADINYFRKNSNLNIFVNSDFELVGANVQDVINYKLTSSEFGNYNIISNNGIAATFQYNNVLDKILTAQLILAGINEFYSGEYSDVITFTVEYDEFIED